MDKIYAQAPEANLFDDAFRACRSSFYAIGAFSFVLNILMLTPLFYMMNVFDKAVSTGSFSTLASLAVVALFLYSIMAGMEWCRSLVLEHVGAKFDRVLGPRLYRICFEGEAGLNGSDGIGAQPLTDLNGIRQFMSSSAMAAFFDLPFTPLFLLLMLFFHPSLAVVSAVCILLMIIIALANQRSTTSKLRSTSAQQKSISQQTQRNLRNAHVAAAMGMIEPLSTKWRAQQEDLLENQLEAAIARTGFTATTKTLNMVMQSVAITAGATLVISQAISPGVMIAAALLLGKSLMPIQALISGWRQVVDTYGQYTRLRELIATHPAPLSKMPLPPVLGEISISGASVISPQTQKIILQDISLSIKPGQVLMIMGPSAAGKSTLLKMMMGLMPVALGSAKIGGVAAYDYERSDLGTQMGYLPQDIELFDGEVSANIARFGELDHDLVIQAAQDAGVHEMILGLPEGYDTRIGAQSAHLSPGQRQRIALARALYGRPEIVILDEPNSNLDEAGEQALNRVIRNMRELGKTVVIVSHRQGALPFVDYIVVVEEGRIKLQGAAGDIIAAARERKNSAQVKPAATLKPVQNSENTTG